MRNGNARTMHSILTVALLFIGAAVAPSPATAQGSDTPARIWVGFPPGGSSDTIARFLADKLKDELKRPVIVENHPGAGGRVAAAKFKSAPADGSVVMLASDPITVSAPLVFSKLEYDPNDLVPVSIVLEFQFGFAVGTNPNVKTFPEFVQWAKANPASVNYGHPAAGSPPHFFGLMLGKAMGVEMNHVPFQGGAPLVANLMGGQIPAGINTLGDLMDQHRGGKIRVLAVSGEKRAPQLPDVPTFLELGYTGVTGTGFYALYAPAKTPASAVRQWNEAINKVLALPDLRERFFKLGLEVHPSTPEELVQLQKDEITKWRPIIKASGFKAD